MKVVYLDVETTNLIPGQICQLSYIIEKDNNLQGKNFYFEVDYVESEAESIHGLSVEKLKELSGGLKFSDIKFEFLSDIEGAVIIGHNIKFDLGFINSELKDLGIRNKKFCTMEHFTDIIEIPGYGDDYKWPRLEELIDFLEVNNKEIMKNIKKIFKVSKVGFHDSRFDVVGTYLCYKKGLKNKLIPKDKTTMENAKKYLEKRLSKEELNRFYRYTTEFKYLENKVLYHAIKKYFPAAENIMETSKKRITFKIDKLNYEAYGYSTGASISSDEYMENGLKKEVTYKLNEKQYQECIYEAFDYIDILLLYRNLCCYLDKIASKSAYSFPEDLSIIMDNIELRKKARDIGLIFYGTGWGWRLRKNWEDALEREFEKLT